MNIWQALVLAIIEGITEFLPISSTGHMIIASALMGIAHDPLVKVFEISIQFGAILAVVVLYFKRFFRSINFYVRLLCAFIPTMIVGLLLKDYIDQWLESVPVVAVSLLVGGIILLFVDRWFARNEALPDAEPSYLQAAFIGLAQTISMVPGVSRSAATIIGGMGTGLNRKSAAEFSFFLAVPTMAGATVLSIYKQRELVLGQLDNLGIIVFGMVVAFVVALLAIRLFIGYLTKYGFRAFGWYRIILGLVLLVLLYGTGTELQMF